VHAGWIISFVVGGCFLVGGAVEALAARQYKEKRCRFLGAAGMLVVAWLAVACNPRGIAMWAYPFDTVGLSVLRAHVMEWMSPSFQGNGTWAFLVLLALPLVVGNFLGRERLRFTEIVLILAVGFMGLLYQRNIYFLSAVAAVPLCRVIDAAVRQVGLRGSDEMLAQRDRRLWGLVVVALLSLTLNLWANVAPYQVVRAARETYPVDAVNWLNHSGLEGRLFNTYNWGGYLILFAPHFPVSIDPRSDLYGDVGMQDWLNVANGQGWRQTLDRDRVQIVLMEKTYPLYWILQDTLGWRVVYSDNLAAIFVRADTRETF
jgi:hypothetical protein